MGRRPCSLTQARPALALGAEGAQRYLAAHACRGIPRLEAGWTVHVTVLEFQNIVWLRSTFSAGWTSHRNCAQAVGPVVALQAIATLHIVLWIQTAQNSEQPRKAIREAIRPPRSLGPSQSLGSSLQRRDPSFSVATGLGFGFPGSFGFAKGPSHASRTPNAGFSSYWQMFTGVCVRKLNAGPFRPQAQAKNFAPVRISGPAVNGPQGDTLITFQAVSLQRRLKVHSGRVKQPKRPDANRLVDCLGDSQDSIRCAGFRPRPSSREDQDHRRDHPRAAEAQDATIENSDPAGAGTFRSSTRRLRSFASNSRSLKFRLRAAESKAG